MARWKVCVSEIEALRSRLGEIALTDSGLPDDIRQKFERLLTIAHDEAHQDEAVRLSTELYQFHEQLRAPQRRRRSSGPVRVTVQMEPPLLTALEKFIAGREGIGSREKAVKVILEDALTEYGLPSHDQPRQRESPP